MVVGGKGSCFYKCMFTIHLLIGNSTLNPLMQSNPLKKNYMIPEVDQYNKIFYLGARLVAQWESICLASG